MFQDGTLYFEEHITDEKFREKNNMEYRHRVQMYYGYAFESFCTSDTPPVPKTAPTKISRNPAVTLTPLPDPPEGWSGDVDTSIQWCNVVKTKLGNNRLIIGGEVDCVRGKLSERMDNLVELKTSLTIRGHRDEAKFEKKLLKFYFQSFLLGVPEIVVGFRSPVGILTYVQSFETISLPRLVRGKPGAWDPSVCLEWGDRFIRFLQDFVSKESLAPAVQSSSSPTLASDDPEKGDQDQARGELSKDHAIHASAESPVPVWRVTFTPKTGISVKLLDQDGVADVASGDDVNRIGFLPRWYYEEIQADVASRN